MQLQFISNDSKRKTTFKKRKKGLFKKVSEISTLCGVDACAIIYSRYDPQPEVWPSHLGARQVIKKLKRMSEIEQNRKKETHESFIRQRINKGMEQVKKQQKDNRDKELTNLMYQGLVGHEFLGNMDINDINDLASIIDQHLSKLNLRNEYFEEQQLNQQQAGLPSHPVPPPQVELPLTPVMERGEPSTLPSCEVITTPYTPHNLGMDEMLWPSWLATMNGVGTTNLHGGIEMTFSVRDKMKAFWTTGLFP